MTFADPVLLVIGLVVAVALAWAAIWVARRRAAALAAAGVAPTGGPGRGRRRRPGLPGGAWLSIAGVAVLAVAFAGPAASVPVSHASGTVILAMDVSGSMAATDVTPDRLSAAKQAAVSFIDAQPGTVDIGVVAFQRGGLEAALPTADHATAAAAVSRLTSGGGTSLGDAILASLAAITHRTVALGPDGSAPSIGFWPSATIVLFSDGQDESGGTGSGGGSGPDPTAAAAAAVAEKAGVHVDTVGVGTVTGTTVDVDGYHLFTALDAAALESISQATGGTYHPASNAGELNGIASSIDLRLTVTNEPLPLAGAFIALALVLLAAGAVLTVMRTGRVV